MSEQDKVDSGEAGRAEEKETGGMILVDIFVVDAPNGSGKTSAAVRMMKEQEGKRSFVYVAPNPGRAAEVCSTVSEKKPKRGEVPPPGLKELLSDGVNVALTRSQFEHMDGEALHLCRTGGYSLILDDDLEVLRKLKMTKRERTAVLDMTRANRKGRLEWKDWKYDGPLNPVKEMADHGELFLFNNSLAMYRNAARLDRFREAWILTHMFDGSLMRPWLECSDFAWMPGGVARDRDGPVLMKCPCRPLHTWRSWQIQIMGEAPDMKRHERFNAPGEAYSALTERWYRHVGNGEKPMRLLRDGLSSLFRGGSGTVLAERLWTTFPGQRKRLTAGDKNRIGSYVPLDEPDAENHGEVRVFGYLANRFLDNFTENWFEAHEVETDTDAWALREVTRLVMQTRIRHGDSVFCYIPSSRMRYMFMDWLDEQKRIEMQWR